MAAKDAESRFWSAFMDVSKAFSELVVAWIRKMQRMNVKVRGSFIL